MLCFLIIVLIVVGIIGLVEFGVGVHLNIIIYLLVGAIKSNSNDSIGCCC